jgi:hypothetical protein
VHAGRACQPGDVGAVVHDQAGAKRRADGHYRGGGVEKGSAGSLLGAKLKKGRPAFEARARKLERGPTGLRSRVDIDNDV